jgi:hypothetical protein
MRPIVAGGWCPDYTFRTSIFGFFGSGDDWRGTPWIHPCRLDDRLPAVDTPARRLPTLPNEAENGNASCMTGGAWLSGGARRSLPIREH